MGYVEKKLISSFEVTILKGLEEEAVGWLGRDYSQKI